MVLFDLDGTLLPMDQEAFTRRYFGALAQKLAPMGYDPKKLIDSLWLGVKSMVKNDGSCTNEQAFWKTFASLLGDGVLRDIPVFDAFYRNEFIAAKDACGFNPLAAKAVARVKELGLRVALATNPLFPSVATERRIAWAGLAPEDFELYTTYENSKRCKPNPDYYREVAQKLGVDPQECLMVGNDAYEDRIASETGMDVFLITDCLIRREEDDISACPHGDFEQFMEYLEQCAADTVQNGESPV